MYNEALGDCSKPLTLSYGLSPARNILKSQ
jgi:hypothetical protein